MPRTDAWGTHTVCCMLFRAFQCARLSASELLLAQLGQTRSANGLTPLQEPPNDEQTALGVSQRSPVVTGLMAHPVVASFPPLYHVPAFPLMFPKQTTYTQILVSG